MPKILDPLKTEDLQIEVDDCGNTTHLIAESYDYPTNHTEISLTVKLKQFGIIQSQENSVLKNEKLQEIVNFIFTNTGIKAE